MDIILQKYWKLRRKIKISEECTRNFYVANMKWHKISIKADLIYINGVIDYFTTEAVVYWSDGRIESMYRTEIPLGEFYDNSNDDLL